MYGIAHVAPVPLAMVGTGMLVRVATPDSEHGDEYAAPVTIGNVRYDAAPELSLAPTGSDAPAGHALSDGPSGRVYVDATSPGAFEVPVGSLVSVDGSDWMTVRRCSRHTDFAGRTHHWELEVR